MQEKNINSAVLNEKYQIQEITVENLFGTLNYKLNFNSASGISILIAPNGCGKTTLFKLLNFLFDPNSSSFLSVVTIPFTLLCCKLSNGEKYEIRRNLANIDLPSPLDYDSYFPYHRSLQTNYLNWLKKLSLKITITAADKQTYKFEISTERKNLSSNDDDPLPNEKKYIDRIAFYLQYLNLKKCDERFLSYIYDLFSSISDNYKFFLEEHQHLVPITFITANRLDPISSLSSLKIDENRYYRRRLLPRFEYPDGDNQGVLDVLQRSCNDAKEIIQNTLNEYNKLLNEAKNKLPMEYLSSDNVKTVDFQEFKQQWENYTAKLEGYQTIGLLPDANESNILKVTKLEKKYENRKNFLNTYLRIFEDCLTPLEPLYNKMILLTKIFNERNKITHKTLKFTEDGFQIENNGQPLDIHCLSSGEKNDFIMFFYLIFKIQGPCIILIDEPEISLHIEWQENFIDYVDKICKINHFQAVIATHSPNIISNHSESLIHKETRLNKEEK